MATITVPAELIEDYLLEHDPAIEIMSFCWAKGVPTPEIEIDYVLDHDLKYEDNDYVNMEDFEKLQRQNVQYLNKINELELQLTELQQRHEIVVINNRILNEELNNQKQCQPVWKKWFKS